MPTTRELERFLGEVIKGVQGVQRTETLIALSSAKETMSVSPDPLGSGKAG